MNTRLLRLLRYKKRLIVEEIRKHERAIVRLKPQLADVEAKYAAEERKYLAEKAEKAKVPPPVKSQYARNREYKRQQRAATTHWAPKDCREDRLAAEARVAGAKLRAVSLGIPEDEPIGS